MCYRRAIRYMLSALGGPSNGRTNSSKKKAELAAQRTQTYQCIHYGLGTETTEPRVGSSRIVPDEVAGGDCLFGGITAPDG